MELMVPGNGSQQTDQALSEKSAEIDGFFSTALDLLCIADTDGHFVRLNPEWERTLGYRLDELQGKRFIDFVHPDDVAATLQRLADLAGQNKVWDFTNRYRHKDGSYRWIEWRSVPAGKVIYAAARDVTQRMKSDQALLESERLNRMIAEMASDYIFHVSVEPDGQAVMDYASKSFTEITGRSLEQTATVDRWRDVVHPDDIPKVMAALAHVVTERQPIELECRSFVRGAVRWTHLYARPELDGHGQRTVGIIGAVKDVTERKRMEDERGKLQDQLQQAMKMEAIGRLAGGLAHDFNNLLTGIVGNVDLALMEVDPSSPLAATLREVNKAGHSAAALTHQLLAFSRKQIIEPKVLSLNDLITDLERMLARIIGEDVALHFAGDPLLGPVRIDPGQFEQVIVNLAVNARDAMPRGGTLVIETENVDLDESYCATHGGVQPGKYVLLAVTDTGSGMTKEVKEHLFEPFFTTKPKGRGTGLGLATIYGAVTQAGGSVDVSSEVDKGTAFRIYLPRSAEKAGTWARGRWAQSLPTGTETVLLVEDEQIVRTLAHKILSRLGYAVLSAGNGNEAIMMAEKRTEPIDLLLTDVVMPGMSGRDLAEHLSRLHPEMKVLYASGYTADVIGRHGVLEEGTQFIGKPYSPQDLATKLRDVLDGKGEPVPA
jgi:two-component system, cell cycle sensor histidine kinase and response regulator CckA